MPSSWLDEDKLNGVSTGRTKNGNRLDLKAPEEPSTVGRLVSLATSGQAGIKALTGYDIDESLPGWLAKPIDMLVNPLGIASLASAAFTGGASLAALPLGSRLAGAAIKDIAGGLVGTAAGQAASNYIPGPDWLKAGVGLGAGVLAGAKTAGAVGKRLPLAFDATRVTTGERAVNLLDKRYDMRQNPLPIEDADLSLAQIQKMSNIVKRSTTQGVPAQVESTPILDQSQKVLGIAREDAKLFQYNIAAIKANSEMFIRDTDEATLIKVQVIASGIDDWVPIADAAAKPSLYKMSKLQKDVLYQLSRELESYRRMYRSVGGKIGRRADIENGGFYLPRGIEETFTADPAAEVVRTLVKTPDAAKAAKYATQAEGIANGVKYPKFADAVDSYLNGISQATVGKHAANQFAKLKTADGTYIFLSPEEMISPTLSRSYLNAEAKSYGLERKLEEASNGIIDAQNQLDTLSPSSFLNTEMAKATLQKKISELQQYSSELEIEIGNHRPIFDSVKESYEAAIAAVRADPSLGAIDSANLPYMFSSRGEALYGPKEITDAISAQLNPEGLYTSRGRKIANSINSPLRLFHTFADISDFGRLAGTAGLMHPFDFFKGIQTGFKSFFSPAALVQDFKGIDLELTAANISFRVKDFLKYGEMPMSNVDVDLGILNKIPGGEWLKSVSNITQNGITSMRAHMIKTELLNMKAAGRTIDEAAVTEAVRSVKLTTGASIHRGIKGADAFIQFPNWLQSQFEFVGHSAAGLTSFTGLTTASPESRYAAKSMFRLVGVGIATTYAVNAMGGQKTELKNGVPLMRIGNTTVDVFGPYGALARGMYAAMNGDIEPLIRSRVSPLFQIGWDLGTGKTFMGDTASFDDPEYWAQAFLPFSVTGAARTAGDPEITLLQGAGVRAQKVSSFKLLREQAQETMGLDWSDLSGNQKEQLRKANPELVKALEKQTIDKAAKGDKYAIGSIETEKVNNELLSQQQTLNLLRENGKISPRKFRDQLKTLSYAAAARKQQIRSDYKLDEATSTPSENQTALNGFYDLYTTADSGIIEGGVKIGLPDWDTLDVLEAEYMRTLTPIQQKAVTDKFVRRDPSISWFYANQEVIKNAGYFDAVDVAFEKVKPMAKAFNGSIESYNDLKVAYQRALDAGDLAQSFRLRSITSQVEKHLQLSRGIMTRQNPLLYKAIIENGYSEQALSRPLAANIE